MNQRREPRFETEQPVWITLLGDPEIRLPAQVKNVAARGIGIQLQGPVSVGTAIKIELDDALLLGEVIYCRPGAASFYVGVELEQAICGLGDLARSVRAFSDLPSGPQKAQPVKECRYQDQ